MVFKIDKNVPPPVSVLAGEGGETIRKMKPGDSVLFKEEKDCERFYHLLQFYNRAQTTGAMRRKVDSGWRVWLTAKKIVRKRSKGK